MTGFKLAIPELGKWLGESNAGGFADMEAKMKAELDRAMEGFGSPMARRLDVRETPDGLEVTGQFPGLEEKDLEVSLSGAQLTVKGTHRTEEDEGRGAVHVHGRSVERFVQTVALPYEADSALLRTELRDGQLRIVLPKAPASPPLKTRPSFR